MRPNNRFLINGFVGIIGPVHSIKQEFSSAFGILSYDTMLKISKEQMRIITNTHIYIYFCFLFVRAHITQFNVSVEELGDDFAAKKIKSIYLLGIVE